MYDTYLEIHFSSVGTPSSVRGTITIGGTENKRRRSWAIFGKDDVKIILKEAFCDQIPSIVTESCDLQVLAYDTESGITSFLLKGQ